MLMTLDERQEHRPLDEGKSISWKSTWSWGWRWIHQKNMFREQWKGKKSFKLQRITRIQAKKIALLGINEIYNRIWTGKTGPNSVKNQGMEKELKALYSEWLKEWIRFLVSVS